MEIEKSTDAVRWDNLNRHSRQGSAFCISEFVATLGLHAHFWFVKSKGRDVLGALALSDAGSWVAQPTPLTMYQGVLLSPEIEARPIHSRVPTILAASQALLDAVTVDRSHVSFSLHYKLPDVRAFLWYGIDAAKRRPFRISPRYTAVLQLPDEKNALDEWEASLRESRRQDRKKAIRAGLVVEPLVDAEILVELYLKTFDRQEQEVPLFLLDRLRRIAGYVNNTGAGLMLQVRLPTGEPLSAVLFLRHGANAYYLIAANEPAGRAVGAGSYLMIEAIKMLVRAGVCSIDMCGANSPNRGDFKTSLNADLMLYFDVDWNSGK